MSEQDDFVTIRPRQVVLSHREEAEAPPVESPEGPANQRLIYIGLGVLMVLGLWVFVFLPDQVTPFARVPTGAASDTTDATDATDVSGATPTPLTQRTQTGGTEAPPPFQQLQTDRERERAQDTLSSFVTLQIKLDDDMHVEQWNEQAFSAAQTLANEGDDLFTREQFDAAIGRYSDGIVALKSLVDEGEAKFAAALAAGKAALAALDSGAARIAFDEAALIYPDHPDVVGGLARAASLPEVLDRLDLATEMRAEGDIEGARATYLSIRVLDPATPGIDDALSELDALVEELKFQRLLSDGYAALNERRFNAARKAFNAALSMRPGNQASLAGLAQVAQASTLSRIDALRVQAERQEAAEQWPDALASYEKVLGIAGSLKFARDGRARVAGRARLDEQLVSTIREPHVLSSDERFNTAVSLYERATRVPKPGPRLTEQLDQLEAILARAAEHVRVTLVSDDATEITVFQVGFLGTFERHQLTLRPGRYVIKGSRHGYRDVRLEVDVEPDMALLDVRCRERL
jgi:tetratricopeptide (TPR) repeat protein